MADRLVSIADGFWNIRGSFKIMGMLDVGTQSSLVRLTSGRFVLLDAYTLSGEVERQVMDLTDQGQAIEAIINTHPFHTVHVKAMAERLPHARLYGTARHHQRFPDLPWAPERTETPVFAALYAADFHFSVPAGVDFIPSNENLHFASVLAFHNASSTLHVDDTLNWMPFPLGNRLSLHPTLKRVLQPRPGAVAEFRTWAAELVERCESVRHICTAHARLESLSDDPPGGIARRVETAVARVEKVLSAHEARHG